MERSGENIPNESTSKNEEVDVWAIKVGDLLLIGELASGDGESIKNPRYVQEFFNDRGERENVTIGVFLGNPRIIHIPNKPNYMYRCLDVDMINFYLDHVTRTKI